MIFARSYFSCLSREILDLSFQYYQHRVPRNRMDEMEKPVGSLQPALSHAYSICAGNRYAGIDTIQLGGASMGIICFGGPM